MIYNTSQKFTTFQSEYICSKLNLETWVDYKNISWEWIEDDVLVTGDKPNQHWDSPLTFFYLPCTNLLTLSVLHYSHLALQDSMHGASFSLPLRLCSGRKKGIAWKGKMYLWNLTFTHYIDESMHASPLLHCGMIFFSKMEYMRHDWHVILL